MSFRYCGGLKPFSARCQTGFIRRRIVRVASDQDILQTVLFCQRQQQFDRFCRVMMAPVLFYDRIAYISAVISVFVVSDSEIAVTGVRSVGKADIKAVRWQILSLGLTV